MVSSQVFEICSKSESLPTWKAYPKSQLIFNFAMLQEDTLSIQCQDMDSAQLIDEFSIFGPHHLDLSLCKRVITRGKNGTSRNVYHDKIYNKRIVFFIKNQDLKRRSVEYFAIAGKRLYRMKIDEMRI